MNRNLINGQPLEFGNREQIKLIRKANDLYEGRKAVATVQESYEDEDEAEEFECEVESYQYLNFTCIMPNCQHNIYRRSVRKYFSHNDTFRCEGCEAEYQIRDCECFHLPNND